MFLVIVQHFIQTFLYTTPNHQPDNISLSWSLLNLIKSHLFSKFLILFWVELIQLSLWIQALKLFFFYFIKHVWKLFRLVTIKLRSFLRSGSSASWYLFEWHHSCLFHVCPLRKVRKKQVLIEFIQDVIKKIAREGGSKVNVLFRGLLLYWLVLWGELR